MVIILDQHGLHYTVRKGLFSVYITNSRRSPDGIAVLTQNVFNMACFSVLFLCLTVFYKIEIKIAFSIFRMQLS